jgi:hypothetical protein
MVQRGQWHRPGPMMAPSFNMRVRLTIHVSELPRQRLCHEALKPVSNKERTVMAFHRIRNWR